MDYGHLLAFSGESKPSVIIFRVANNSLQNLFSRIQKSVKQIEAPLLEGAIVVIEDLSIRIRSLPIKVDKSE